MKKTGKAKRFLAWFLTLAMVMTFAPSFDFTVVADEPTVIQSDTKENTNQAGGIIYTKTSTAKSDGTIDITLTAHTTGEVRQMTSVSPTDIVLVLDVSGSMNDPYSSFSVTNYEEVLGKRYTYRSGWSQVTGYGFNNQSNYYINTGTAENPVYTRVSRTARDNNGYEYFEYTRGNTRIYVYPELESGTATNRSNNNYGVYQFYSAQTTTTTTSRMDVLKSAVESFINTTATMNEGLEASEMHTISIVKFAGEQYSNGTTNTPVITEGDGTYTSGGNTYNYSQVVKGLTAVDATGAAALRRAVNNLSPAGSTAVDKGLALAEAVLMNRSQVVEDGAVDRNEVIVVFTDGEPNYFSGFDEDVADDAIGIAGKMKNTAGVTIYGVSVAPNADASDLDADINKFMHYVSSNYTTATSMDSDEDDCDTSAGYYMTPDDSTTLTMIFESIIQNIDHPTITMGEEATMVDTISPYFDFQGTVDDVKLQTSARNSDGTWADPVDDENLVANITNDRLTVDGFDFDSNYVSETGRGDNKDFYGKRLVVSFTVVPDYDVIDVASATLMDGILPTNSGFAALVDSNETSAADVATPELEAHQVTYKVDGDEYTTYNRFTGSDIEVDAEPTKLGYTFSGWTIDGEEVDPGDIFTMPNEDVEVVGTFTANTYNVTYQYSTTPPTGAPSLPTATTAQYGDTITVANQLELQGYVFVGWYPLQTDVTVTEGTFTMPAKDVTLVGYFESSTNTPYKIEHYLETLTDDVYEATPELSETFYGTTDNVVTATPLNRFTGFTYNEIKSADTISDKIKADGTLVLKVYYDRNEYNVTYGYDGDTQIDGLPELPNSGTYKYGEEVSVADKAVPPAGYTFTGWYRGTVDNPVEGTFTMPAYNVNLLGYFTANSGTQYKVEHYLMGTDGEYAETPEVTETFTGTTDHNVTATPLTTFEGFTYNEGVSNASGTIAGDGSLILELYYDRNKYTVTYAYERTVPADATALPTEVSYYHGETVDIAADATATGYTFSGWHIHGEDVTATNGSFEMPKRNVNVYGYFTANTDTPYTVEHYVEKLDGTGYEETPHTTQNLTGTTDTEVTASSISIPGFTYNASASTVTGIITGDGSLVLKLYYDRNDYKVTYEYEGDIPTGTPALPTEETYVYGANVTVADRAEAPVGYTFIGWYRGEVTNIVTAFEMPDRDVVIRGYFSPGENTPYTIHHYMETSTDGVYETTPELTESFTGTTGHTVTATPLNRFTGFKYNETKSAPTISGEIEGDGSLILKVYYDREEYTVTYGYDGDVPAGAPALPTGGTYAYGADVPVAAKATAPAGYTFVGWYRGTEDNPVSGTFKMPNFNVNILGNFEENTNTPYRVEHYLQTKDGEGYELDGIGEIRHGTTDTTVSALPKEYPGFTYNSGMSKTSGIIAGDGTLVLKFYYDRNTHNVTYVYEGITPDGTPAVPEALNGVYFGTDVTVANAPAVPGYTFSGWTTEDATISAGKFSMPDKDVVLKGSFTSNEVDYKVNYWFQKVDAGSTFNKADYELDADSYTRKAFVGQHVEADAKQHTGFSVNAEHSKSYGHVTVDANGVGNLVLDVYFDRHTYNVTYGYYGEQPDNAPDLSNKNKASVRYGTVLDVETKPTLDGYSFDGWYTRTANVVDNKFTMPDHDVAFLGRFIAQYTVSYDLNGATGAEGVDYTTKTVNSGTEITVNEAPTRSGYTFTGWKEADNTFNAGDTATVDRNITFVAQWSYNGGGGGGGSTKYTLTYETNGGNAIAKETYNAGTVAKLTKIPVKDGFVFEGWHLDKALTEDVSEVKMTKNITVYAAWVEDNGSAGNGYETPDVLNGEDHFAYVVGYPDGTVRPNDNISRAEVTAIFFRLLKDEIRDANLTENNNFSDIKVEDWHNMSISTMSKLGIVNGRYETIFAPDANITRAEFATICARFDDGHYEVIDNFTDIDGHWAEADIHEAAAKGWIRGYADGTFKPDQFITRAEAMTMINRVLNRVPENAEDLLDDMVKWPDNSDVSVWYYLPVQEATNSHDYVMKNNVYEKWTSIKEATDWTKYE